MPDLDGMLMEIEKNVLELYCLFSCCATFKTSEGQQFLSRDYVLEKTKRVLNGIPLSLDSDARKLLESMNKEIPPRLYHEDGIY